MRYTKTDRASREAGTDPRIPRTDQAAADALNKAARFLEGSDFDLQAACRYLRDLAAERVATIPDPAPVVRIAPAGGGHNNTGSPAPSHLAPGQRQLAEAPPGGDGLTPERRRGGVMPPSKILRAGYCAVRAVAVGALAMIAFVVVSIVVGVLGDG